MRRLLVVLVVAAVLVMLALLALVESLGRGQLKGAVETRLSAMLGQRVAIGRLSVSVFPIALSGTDVYVGQARVQAPAVAIESVRIIPQLRSLMSATVAVEEIQLEAFTIFVLRDENGRWHLPSVVPVPTPTAGGGGVTIERVRIARGRIRLFDRRQATLVLESGSIDDLGADVSIESGGLRFSPIAGRIGAARISGAAHTEAGTVRMEFAAEQIADGDLPIFVRLLGSERPSFLKLTQPASASVSLHIDRATSRLSGSGVLKAPHVVLDPLQLQRLDAPFVVDGPRLAFSPTTFAMYGGEHRGTVTVSVDAKSSAWVAESRVINLGIGQFLNALTGREQQLDGTASLNASLRGLVGESLQRTVRGRTQLTVINGVIRRFPLVATINRALRLATQEGDDTRFERLSGTFAVASGVASTDDLVLEAGHIRVSTAGRVGAEGSIALRGVAVISAERAAAAVASVHEFARLRNSRGEIELPLTISGTFDAPSFGIDVAGALRKGVMDELRRRIRRFIR